MRNSYYFRHDLESPLDLCLEDFSIYLLYDMLALCLLGFL